MRRDLFLPLVWCALGSALVSAATMIACRTPTEVKVTVDTDFDCSALSGNMVAVRVGGTIVESGPVGTTSTACANKHAGTLYLTPTNNGSHVAIEVMAALAPATLDADGNCVEGAPGCIHARRALNYLSNTILEVPITLEADCAGLRCEPNETCKGQRCVPADCKDSQCTLGAPDGGDAGDPLATICGDRSVLQAGAPFPMSSGCAGGGAFSLVSGPSVAPTREDTVPLSAIATNVVIDKDNIAYVTTDDGKLHAISLATASELWAATLQQGSMGSGSVILAADGTIYAANDTAIVPLSFDGGSAGTPAAASQQIRSDLNITPSGRIVFSLSTNAIASVDTKPKLVTGPSVPVSGAVDGMRAVFANGFMWNGANDAIVDIIDPSTMALSGTVSLDGGTGSYVATALGVDGLVRVVWGVGSGTFFYGAIDPVARKLAWSHTVPGGMFVQVDIASVTPTGAMWVIDDARDLTVVAPNGDVQSTVLADARYPGFDVDGNVYTGLDSTGALSSYDEHGNQRWATTNPHSLHIVVVGKDGIIIATDVSQTQAYVFRP